MGCGVGCRCGSDPTLLWLWHRLEATAPIQPLAWESPYAAGTALEKTKKKKNLWYIGCRHGLDPLWLRHRLVAAALIRLLAWEPPYAVGVAIKSQKKGEASENQGRGHKV